MVDVFSFVLREYSWCDSHQIKSRINHWAFSISEAKGPDPCLCKTTEPSAVCCPTVFISVHLLSAGWRAQAERGERLTRTTTKPNFFLSASRCLCPTKLVTAPHKLNVYLWHTWRTSYIWPSNETKHTQANFNLRLPRRVNHAPGSLQFTAGATLGINDPRNKGP